MNLMKTSAVALSFALLGAPAMAQQNGLVNVDVTDVLNNNTVVIAPNIQVPVAIAANVCGVDVNVLAQDIGDGDAECTATAESAADNRQFLRFAGDMADTITQAAAN